MWLFLFLSLFHSPLAWSSEGLFFKNSIDITYPDGGEYRALIIGSDHNMTPSKQVAVNGYVSYVSEIYYNLLEDAYPIRPAEFWEDLRASDVPFDLDSYRIVIHPKGKPSEPVGMLRVVRGGSQLGADLTGLKAQFGEPVTKDYFYTDGVGFLDTIAGLGATGTSEEISLWDPQSFQKNHMVVLAGAEIEIKDVFSKGRDWLPVLYHLAERYHLFDVPEQLFVDEKGNVTGKHPGLNVTKDVEQELSHLSERLQKQKITPQEFRRRFAEIGRQVTPKVESIKIMPEYISVYCDLSLVEYYESLGFKEVSRTGSDAHLVQSRKDLHEMGLRSFSERSPVKAGVKFDHSTHFLELHDKRFYDPYLSLGIGVFCRNLSLLLPF